MTPEERTMAATDRANAMSEALAEIVKKDAPGLTADQIMGTGQTQLLKAILAAIYELQLMIGQSNKELNDIFYQIPAKEDFWPPVRMPDGMVRQGPC